MYVLETRSYTVGWESGRRTTGPGGVSGEAFEQFKQRKNEKEVSKSRRNMACVCNGGGGTEKSSMERLG